MALSPRSQAKSKPSALMVTSPPTTPPAIAPACDLESRPPLASELEGEGLIDEVLSLEIADGVGVIVRVDMTVLVDVAVVDVGVALDSGKP